MATVRLQRRARLAEKLRDIFELDGIEEVWAGSSLCCLICSLCAHAHRRNALLAPTVNSCVIHIISSMFTP